MKNGCLAFALFAFGVSTAFAQSDPNIEPDRPDVTNGTHIVPPGIVQIEFGGGAGVLKVLSAPSTVVPLVVATIRK